MRPGNVRKEETETKSEESRLRSWLIKGGILLLVFLLGLVPMWFYSQQLSGDVKAKDMELRRSRIYNTLTSATIYARRGEYETARQNASTFFTEVRSEIDKADAGILNQQERAGLDRVMAERDEVITLLSRNDPASAERLSNLFVEYEGVIRTK